MKNKKDKRIVERTRGCNTLTEAGYRAWIVSLLRRGSLRWKPRSTALSEALTGKKCNRFTGRVANHYLCANCKEEFPLNMVHVDHIKPVVGEEGFTTWDDYIHNMFCEKENFRVLCKECHKTTTMTAREARKKRGAK